MNNRRLVIIGIILGAILIILVIVSSLIGGFRERQDRRGPAPTLSPLQREQKIQEIKSNIRSIPSSTASSLSTLDRKLPQTNSDFEMIHSPVVGQYFIRKKTPQADQKINDFLRENGISSIDDVNRTAPIFVIVSEPVQNVAQKKEEEFISNKDEGIQESGPTPTSPPIPTPGVDQQTAKDAQLLSELFKTILTFELETVETPSAGGEQVPSGQLSQASGALAAIFNEAGSKVGVAPKLLESFMRVECGRLLALPDEVINAYSQPGSGLPPNHYCFGNAWGAHGPMQFIRTTWARYASSVNRYGGYTHTPYIENIRDSVYAAAEKIKLDGRAANPFSWNQEEVYRSGRAYCGRCHEIPACPNYCQRVWANYSTN